MCLVQAFFKGFPEAAASNEPEVVLKGVVLDGCPRSAAQAGLLVGAGVQFTAVVHVKGPKHENGAPGRPEKTRRVLYCIVLCVQLQLSMMLGGCGIDAAVFGAGQSSANSWQTARGSQACFQRYRRRW